MYRESLELRFSRPKITMRDITSNVWYLGQIFLIHANRISLAMLTATAAVLVSFLAKAVIAKPGIDGQIAFLESSNSSLLVYPTQFTQGIVPKAIHSHNDCKFAPLIQ